MEFRHDTDPRILILEADEELDAFSGRAKLQELQLAIDGGVRILVVDCSGVGYVSSIAVCTLVRLHKRMAEYGGELRLAAVQPPLRRILSITRLDEVFHLNASVDEARLQAFEPRVTSPH
jgi:anti-anti-sigma factor